MCSTNFSTQATNVLIVLRSEQSEVCISTITKRGVDQESSFACYDCNNDEILLQAMLVMTTVCRIPIATLGGAAIQFEYKCYSDIDGISKLNNSLI